MKLALRHFQWLAGIRSLAASSRQPTPDFALVLNAVEVSSGQLLGVVRADHLHPCPRMRSTVSLDSGSHESRCRVILRPRVLFYAVARLR